MNDDPLLSVRNLVGFLEGASGLRRILDGVDLQVTEGRSFALLGESGSGKTFLVQSLFGLHSGQPGIVSGSVQIAGENIFEGWSELIEFDDSETPKIRKNEARCSKLLENKLSGLIGASISLVPQDPHTSLPNFLKVERLMQRAVLQGQPGLSKTEALCLGSMWLERVHMYGVDEVLSRYLHELSGGMAQRVALAAALASGPRLLFADEPTTGLDASIRARVLALLIEAVEKYGSTLFLITHDTEAARLTVRDVAILCSGRIVEEGPVDIVLNPDARPKHPYTMYLLEAEEQLRNSVSCHDPSIDGNDRRRSGCGFRDRCRFADPECSVEKPALSDAGRGHRLACPKGALS